jgi:hypothetical protein
MGVGDFEYTWQGGVLLKFSNTKEGLPIGALADDGGRHHLEVSCRSRLTVTTCRWLLFFQSSKNRRQPGWCVGRKGTTIVTQHEPPSQLPSHKVCHK